MFVLESYLKKRRDAISAWEEDCKEWTRDSPYRNKLDYQHSHPYPVVNWGYVFTHVALPIFGILAVSLTVVVMAVNYKPVPQKSHKATSDCSTVVKKGDTIGVSYGSFAGSKGTVIRQNQKNCSVDITITDSTNTFDQCKAESASNTCDGVLSNGMLLHINKSDNVIPIK